MNEQNLEIVEAEKLYEEMMAHAPFDGFMESENLGEDMQVVNDKWGSWWKHSCLLNHAAKRAYRIIDSYCILQHVTQEDVDWDKLKGVPEKLLERARNLNARYPFSLSKFQEGVSIMNWQLNPDGRYFMDSDGYGMTDDKEFSIYGCVDKALHVLVKFRPIKRWPELDSMRAEGQRIVSGKSRMIDPFDRLNRLMGTKVLELGMKREPYWKGSYGLFELSQGALHWQYILVGFASDWTGKEATLFPDEFLNTESLQSRLGCGLKGTTVEYSAELDFTLFRYDFVLNHDGPIILAIPNVPKDVEVVFYGMTDKGKLMLFYHWKRR